ncbi:MAG TPA: hypothetical protein VMT81_02875 [Candidatus Paceibacterota bacterium]|nr:hypothetical protein [Candidatus Paceibacterota bacterium]
MIGHEKVIAYLKSLRERGALGHGYIFYGPAMVGKKLAALLFANYLEHGKFEEDGVMGDLMLLAPPASGPGSGSIGIDAVRDIKNFLWRKPNASPRRTLIIDDADLLTTEAQNALLKITEEPPASSLLILITSDITGILPTIQSRLPKIYFGTVPGTVKKAMGKPGLAWRLENDGAFKERIGLAEKLLKTPAAERRDVIKKIIEPEDFNFRKFLDAMVVVLAWRGAGKENAALWHKALQLYDRETNFSLNPRLQLESFLA